MQARILIVSSRKGKNLMIDELQDRLQGFGIESIVYQGLGLIERKGRIIEKKDYTLALIDLDCVTYGGFDSYATLEDITSMIPSILVAERGSLEKWARALESGAVSFITRPLNSDRLARSILRIISRNIKK